MVKMADEVYIFRKTIKVNIIISKGRAPLEPPVNASVIGQIIRSLQFALTTALNGNSFHEC